MSDMTTNTKRKYKVSYETRDYHTMIVEAETKEDAVDQACIRAWPKRRHDVYEIHKVEES